MKLRSTLRVQKEEFIVVVSDAGSACCASKLRHRLLFKGNQQIIVGNQTTTITHLILCGTFPVPSNDVIAAPALPSVVFAAVASIVDEFEVSVACTLACFELCQGGGFRVPVEKRM